MSSESDSEDSDVEFAKAVQRGSNRRGAVVQQTARRRLRTPEKDRLNPMRQTWAGGGRHASRKTDLGSISSANQLTPSQQLRAAALAGDLPWIMQLMASEVEALGIMRQCEPTVKRLRMRRVELAKTIRNERATVAEAKVEMEAGLAAVERCARPLLPPRLPPPSARDQLRSRSAVHTRPFSGARLYTQNGGGTGVRPSCPSCPS